MEFDVLTGRAQSQAMFDGAQLVSGQSRGFFLGKTYRMYKEFTANTVLRVVATKPFILTAQSLYVDTGAARAMVVAGGTAGGTFTALPTVFGKNGNVPSTPDIVITQGGTVTGGTEREVLRSAAGSGSLLGGSPSGSVSGAGSMRMLPAGTYFISIVVTGSTSGLYSIEYEET